MINLKGKCQIEVTLEGLESLTPDNFLSLDIEEDAGGMPASFDLVLRQSGYDLLPTISVTNSPIIISYGKDASSRRTYDFYIVNYSYQTGEDGILRLTLTGLRDLGDFVSKPAISYVEGTSDKVFKTFSTIEPDISYSGSDEQVWIRHNITEKAWMDRVIHHIYISKEDVPLPALTIEGCLVITSAKEALSREPILRLTNAENETDSIKIHTFELLSNTAYFSKFMSEGRRVQTVSLLKRVLEDPVEKPTNIDGQVYTKTTDNMQFPPILDHGNCHDNYYHQRVRNLSMLVDFERHLVTIPLRGIYFSDKELRLLDPVHFIPTESSSGLSSSFASGKYLLVSKKVKFTQEFVLTELTLGRPHHVQSS